MISGDARDSDAGSAGAVGSRRPALAIRLVLVVAGVAAALALAETFLRIEPTFPYPYCVWPPNLRKVFHPDPQVMPGVSGESRFVVSSAGIRGDEIAPDQRYRMLALGGSTTECLYLDQSEAWPQLLQQSLGPSVWVGNVGKSGRSTRHHVVQVKHLLPQYPRIDAIIVLAGVNDFLKRLEADRNYRTDPPESNVVRWAFDVSPLRGAGERSAVSRLIDGARTTLGFRQAGLFQDDEGQIYLRWRGNRKSASALLDELPDLDAALDEYARNLARIVDLARAREARVIFLTQPAMWRKDLSPAGRDLLWMGGIGNYRYGEAKAYYSVDALAAGLARYNRRLLEVCAERDVECIDLTAEVTDPSLFYDDVHFNEEGARRVAAAILARIGPSVAETVAARRAG